jgi:hypothetical protein
VEGVGSGAPAEGGFSAQPHRADHLPSAQGAPGSPPWRTHHVLADLIGGPEELRAFAPQWEPLFWDLAEVDTHALLASGGEWLAALAVVRAEGEKDAATFREVFAAVLERLKGLSGTDPVRWHGLIWFVLSWALRRRPSAETEALLAAAQSNQANARRRQEVRKMSEEKMGEDDPADKRSRDTGAG